MDNDTFLGIINQIKEKAPDETGEIANLLSDLYTGFTGKSNEVATLSEANTTLKSNNEALKEQNMKLFLKVGSEVKAIAKPDRQEKRTYESLFNEKGELI